MQSGGKVKIYYMSGENFDLENDDKILEIKSPKKSIGGPYFVVFKSVEERFAIVALDWNKKPKLAIRWFWSKKGNPVSRGHATWLVIPPMLHNAILNGLPLDFKLRDNLNRFLTGEISGNELKERG